MDYHVQMKDWKFAEKNSIIQHGFLGELPNLMDASAEIKSAWEESAGWDMHKEEGNPQLNIARWELLSKQNHVFSSLLVHRWFLKMNLYLNHKFEYY